MDITFKSLFSFVIYITCNMVKNMFQDEHMGTKKSKCIVLFPDNLTYKKEKNKLVIQSNQQNFH